MIILIIVVLMLMLMTAGTALLKRYNEKLEEGLRTVPSNKSKEYPTAYRKFESLLKYLPTRTFLGELKVPEELIAKYAYKVKSECIEKEDVDWLKRQPLFTGGWGWFVKDVYCATPNQFLDTMFSKLDYSETVDIKSFQEFIGELKKNMVNSTADGFILDVEVELSKNDGKVTNPLITRLSVPDKSYSYPRPEIKEISINEDFKPYLEDKINIYYNEFVAELTEENAPRYVDAIFKVLDNIASEYAKKLEYDDAVATENERIRLSIEKKRIEDALAIENYAYEQRKKADSEVFDNLK